MITNEHSVYAPCLLLAQSLPQAVRPLSILSTLSSENPAVLRPSLDRLDVGTGGTGTSSCTTQGSTPLDSQKEIKEENKTSGYITFYSLERSTSAVESFVELLSPFFSTPLCPTRARGVWQALSQSFYQQDLCSEIEFHTLLSLASSSTDAFFHQHFLKDDLQERMQFWLKTSFQLHKDSRQIPDILSQR